MTSAGPRNLDDALIGNCRVAALVDTKARSVRWCTPRFDSASLFPHLLAGDEERGFREVVPGDTRPPGRSDATLLRRRERPGRHRSHVAPAPNADSWEHCGGRRVRTDSAEPCWTAGDRLGRIAPRLWPRAEVAHWSGRAARRRATFLDQAGDLERGALTGASGVGEPDSAACRCSRSVSSRPRTSGS